MARKLDHILVVDVEATCWDGPTPPGMDNEIIEIGVCPLEVATGRRLGKRSIMVRPERSTVSPFCTQLTTITPQMAGAGVSFADACRVLEDEYQSRERVWASYGDYDRRQFERQCAATGTRYPFGPGHLNVKTLFALARRLPREVGTAQGLELLGVTFEGTQHRGADDAWNIAAVLARLLTAMRIGQD